MSTIQLIDGRYYVVNDGVTNSTGTGKTDFDVVFNETLSDTKLEDIFQRMADKYDIPVNLLKAVAKVESNYNMSSISSTGAVGIMQLMPKTAASLGVTDIYDTEQNIEGGAKYLSGAIRHFNGDVALAVAAYNASYAAVDKYGTVPPFAQTQRYVQKIYNLLSTGSTATSGVNPYQQGEYTPLDNVSKATPVDTVSTYQPLERVNENVQVSEATDRLRSIVLGRDKDGNDMTLTESISYDSYMKLLEEFREILDRVFFFDDEEDDKDSFTKSVTDTDRTTGNTTGTQMYQTLYEATSSLYSARAQSLIRQ